MAVRPIDGAALLKELTCDFTGTPFHGNKKVTIGEVCRIIESMPTITSPTVGRCKDCENWDEELSSGRKSLNNYVCTCHECCNPEVGFYRSTSPNDYCSYFEPKEDMEDGKTD